MNIFWTDKKCDLEGSRWSVWEKHYKDMIPWADFKDKVLEFNPNINIKSQWLFVKGWEYTMPTYSNIDTKPNINTEPDFDNITERNKLAQQLLKEDGLYSGNIDGIIGNESLNALSNYNFDSAWSAEKRIVAYLQTKAKEKNINQGEIDGKWTPMAEYVVDNLYRLITQGKTEELWRPEDSDIVIPRNEWPVQYSPEFDSLFGPKGNSNLKSIVLPYKHRLSWDLDVCVSKISCHKEVGKSLGVVLTNVLKHYGEEEIKRLNLDVWGGCFNDRAIRGGNKPSMHSWGIAMDYDPLNNKLKWGRDRANFAKPEYNAWWQCWEEEGWISLGRQKNFDWMHVQAARLR